MWFIFSSTWPVCYYSSNKVILNYTFINCRAFNPLRVIGELTWLILSERRATHWALREWIRIFCLKQIFCDPLRWTRWSLDTLLNCKVNTLGYPQLCPIIRQPPLSSNSLCKWGGTCAVWLWVGVFIGLNWNYSDVVDRLRSVHSDHSCTRSVYFTDIKLFSTSFAMLHNNPPPTLHFCTVAMSEWPSYK